MVTMASSSRERSGAIDGRSQNTMTGLGALSSAAGKGGALSGAACTVSSPCDSDTAGVLEGAWAPGTVRG
ncbi:hypothetical protein MATL_G00165740 [Megalops atlanticus]|uniref:Uncharacterized protein n=1 Tax=Megalops atlanticus TaxID=7932 RepID=A0A9D3PQD6_MEGAT|nr:hypothetical protein MATL_G00165740 [Megalops atlanticus]